MPPRRLAAETGALGTSFSTVARATLKITPTSSEDPSSTQSFLHRRNRGAQEDDGIGKQT